MRNGWTGGQYSLVRAAAGLSLILHSSAGSTRGVAGIAGAAAALLALGRWDRLAAALLAGLLILSGAPLADMEIGQWAWLAVLGCHLAIPPAPYGSWAARGRDDPGGGWRMPPLVVLVARALVVAFWFLIGAGFEVGPLGGVVILHLLALDPAWFSSPRVAPLDLLFYDGSCALCHGAVRFVLAEDPAGTAFRFAPLRGSAFRTAIPEAEQATLPDSIVIRTAAGRTLVRSRAVIRMGMRLGGFWRVIAAGFWLIPVALRDAGYDLVAKWRYRIFGRRQEICPVMGEGLRARFDL